MKLCMRMIMFCLMVAVAVGFAFADVTLKTESSGDYLITDTTSPPDGVPDLFNDTSPEAGAGDKEDSNPRSWHPHYAFDMTSVLSDYSGAVSVTLRLRFAFYNNDTSNLGDMPDLEISVLEPKPNQQPPDETARTAYYQEVGIVSPTAFESSVMLPALTTGDWFEFDVTTAVKGKTYDTTNKWALFRLDPVSSSTSVWTNGSNQNGFREDIAFSTADSSSDHAPQLVLQSPLGINNWILY